MGSPGRTLAALLAAGAASCGSERGSPPPGDVARDRAEYAAWLEQAPGSPYRAVVQHPIGRRLVLGPADADVPLSGVGRFLLGESSGRVTLELDGATRPMWPDRPVSIGVYQLEVAGLPGRMVVTVYGETLRDFKPPAYFPPDPRWAFDVRLEAGGSGRPERLLAPHGAEVEATEAGVVALSLDGNVARLRVFRFPGATSEERELEIFFRDETNGNGTYPAGRFVTLEPRDGDRYRLDFNRARNPFCAYSPVFACPAPWRGNRLPSAVPAGERYQGGGLELPAPPDERES